MTQDQVDFTELDHLLKSSFKLGVSDIHIRSNRKPMYRVDGQLRSVDFREIAATEVEAMVERLSGISFDVLLERRTSEFSCHFGEAGRFRGHFYLQNGKAALALRTIPNAIPTLQELRLPAQLKKLCENTSGLILVTGSTGMGKSTTLAAMLDTIARTSCRHIVTIEDPIEYAIPDHSSCVTQREVGRDVANFEEGLYSALRQDPDVVMIGEARDRQTMDIALRAAVTGHLVLTAVHFTDTTTTIQSLLTLFGGREQAALRYRLADALRAVISLQLIPRRDGGGRIVATELMINEPTVASCIQDENKLKSLRAAIARGRTQLGSHTFDQSLLELLTARVITLDAAQSAAVSPAELLREVNLRRIPT